jgi:hypothetical protein
MHARNKPTFNPDSISIPCWTIKRDMRSAGCIFCRSIIVCVTTETGQWHFAVAALSNTASFQEESRV